MGLRTALFLVLVLLAGQVAGSASARPVAAVGDPSQGERLFDGAVRFQNGGTPCIACHTGAVSGGTLGPSLATVYTRYGGAGALGAVLRTIAFPAMQPVFADRPLTPAERADLTAYLREIASTRSGSQTPPRPQGARFLLFGFLCAALLLSFAQLLWRKRLAGVRRSLVARGAR